MSSAARTSSFMTIGSEIEHASSTGPARAVNCRSKKPRRLQGQAEKVPADDFKNCKLRLRLLRHRVHVAEAALERIAFEDGGGAGGKISRFGDLTGLLAQMDRGHAQPH